MSRHRNVRSMNYEEDFYEDDDYLGHSVEDSYCISPGTAAQFTFNRDKNVDLAHYIEEGIPEEEEEDSDADQHSLNNSSGTPRLQLNDTDQAKLNSCLDEVRNVIGDAIPEHLMAQVIVKNNYNTQPSLNELLNQQGVEMMTFEYFFTMLKIKGHGEMKEIMNIYVFKILHRKSYDTGS